MNLLHIIASMDPLQGGPCQCIRNSIPELEKLGVYNEVVSLDGLSDFILKRKDSFKIHALGPGIKPWCYSPKLIPWLLHNLPRFDLVILHGLWLYHGYALSKAIRNLKRSQDTVSNQPVITPKVFIMPHGMLDPYFQRAKGRAFKAIRNLLYWKLIEANVVNASDGVLFTCEAELQLAREPFRPYMPKQEYNVGLGVVDPPKYNQSMHNALCQKCPQLKESPYLLFLSRIHEKKGVDLLIRAYARILKKVPKSTTSLLMLQGTTGEETIDTQFQHSNFPKLVIAGPGLETPYGQYILSMVEELPELRESVFFPGMLTGDAKWGAFYGCDAFVLPSHQENFGIAVVEALACGKPVLISNQVNIWREIEAAGGGLVAEDTQDGTSGLLEKWQDLSEENSDQMRLKARLTYEMHFAVGYNVQRLLGALKSSD